MFKNQKYLKYLLIGGIAILFLLIVTSSILSHLPASLSSGNAVNTTLPGNDRQNNTSDMVKPTYLPQEQKNNNDLTHITYRPNSSNNSFSNQLISITPEPTKSSGSVSSSSLNTLYNNNPQTIGQQQELLNLPRVNQPTSSTTPSPTVNPVRILMNSMNSLFNFGNTNNQINPPSNPQLSPPSTVESQPGSGNLSNFTYYPQCDGPYDNYSLAPNCNICQAGCGQTTAAMILSSYVDKKFTPPVVADLYAKNGVVNVCKGTNIVDAQNIMKQNGIAITDLIINSSPDNAQIISDFKSYLSNGWALFTLARYCSQGCGHFIWIVDIDSNNNVWTYDPFYGRKQIPPPFNENKYSPFPYYRVAFGVKKP